MKTHYLNLTIKVKGFKKYLKNEGLDPSNDFISYLIGILVGNLEYDGMELVTLNIEEDTKDE